MNKDDIESQEQLLKLRAHVLKAEQQRLDGAKAMTLDETQEWLKKRREDDFEGWLDEARIDIYNETKHMSNAEAAAATNKEGRELAEKYGLRIVKNTDTPAEEE